MPVWRIAQFVEMQADPSTKSTIAKGDGDKYTLTWRSESGPVPVLILSGLNTLQLKELGQQIVRAL